MVAWAAFAAAGSLLLKPLLALFLLIIFMASLGKSLGVRRFYVALLLRMFEVRSSADGRHVGLSLFRVGFQSTRFAVSYVDNIRRVLMCA